MYRSLFIASKRPCRTTFGKQWKAKRLMVANKNKEIIHPTNAILFKCDSIKRLIELECQINKQKYKIRSQETSGVSKFIFWSFYCAKNFFKYIKSPK